MGLQKNITLDNGINLPEAYMKIVSVSITPNIGITLNVSVFKDFSARQLGKPSVIEFQHSCIGSEYFDYFAEGILLQLNKSVLSQAYMWLKTLPFYSSSIDINPVDKE